VILGSKLITGPIEEPVTLDEVKTHLKAISGVSDEDAYLSGLISSARKQAERYTRRAFLTQTWEQYQDGFPGRDFDHGRYNRSVDRHCIHVLRPRLQSIVSLKYLDTSGTLQTMASTDYVVDTGNEPGRIAPKIGVPWPATAGLPQAVIIQFIAGYADTANQALAADPGFNDIKLAIMQLVGHWYFNREPVVAGQVMPLPMHVQQMLLGNRP
jgi:uncharacterized phiE125 gp8 family phage protein